jgi:hypothetical protein
MYYWDFVGLRIPNALTLWVTGMDGRAAECREGVGPVEVYSSPVWDGPAEGEGLVLKVGPRDHVTPALPSASLVVS